MEQWKEEWESHDYGFDLEGYEDELKDESDEDHLWHIFTNWFFGVFWIGFFGIFIWFELPVDVLAMLVHPQSKPHYSEEDDDEFYQQDSSLSQEIFNWTLLKTSDLAHPYGFILGWIFTLGEATYEDYYVEVMTAEEAAIYFFLMWLIWPFLIVINLPMALLLSPLYALLLLIQLGELLIFILFDGDEINENAANAGRQSDDDEIVIDEGDEDDD